MCGIWTYLLKDNEDNVIDENELYKKFMTITDRGPDNYSFKYKSKLSTTSSFIIACSNSLQNLRTLITLSGQP